MPKFNNINELRRRKEEAKYYLSSSNTNEPRRKLASLSQQFYFKTLQKEANVLLGDASSLLRTLLFPFTFSIFFRNFYYPLCKHFDIMGKMISSVNVRGLIEGYLQEAEKIVRLYQQNPNPSAEFLRFEICPRIQGSDFFGIAGSLNVIQLAESSISEVETRDLMGLGHFCEFWLRHEKEYGVEAAMRIAKHYLKDSSIRLTQEETVILVEGSEANLQKIVDSKMALLINIQNISLTLFHILPHALMQRLLIGPLTARLLKPIFLPSNLKVEKLLSSNHSFYEAELLQDTQSLELCILNMKDRLWIANRIKLTLLSLALALAYYTYTYTEHGRKLDEYYSPFDIAMRSLYGFSASVFYELLMAGWDFYHQNQHERFLKNFHQGLNELVRDFSQPAFQFKNKKRKGFEYLQLETHSCFYEKVVFESRKVAEVIKSALIENNVMVAEGGDAVIVLGSQRVSKTQLFNIKSNIQNRLWTAAKREKLLERLAPILRALGSQQELQTAWNGIDKKSQTEASKLFAFSALASKAKRVTASKRNQNEQLQKSKFPTTIPRPLVFSAAAPCWGNKQYQSSDPNCSIVELSAPWLPQRRNYAEMAWDEDQCVTKEQHEEFVSIFRRARIVAPKGQMGFVSADIYVKEHETDDWCYSDLKLKNPERDARIYCTEHEINEQGQTLHRLTTLVQKTHKK